MDIETISMMAIIVLGFSVFMFFTNKNKLNVTKIKTKKTLSDDIEQVLREQTRLMQENYIQQIEILKKDKASLVNKASRFETLYTKLKAQTNDYETEDDEQVNDLQRDYEIDPEKAIQYTQKLGLNPQALNNPALTNILWEKLKENKDMALMLGIIKPRGMAQTITSTTEIKSGYENVLADLQAQGRFA